MNKNLQVHESADRFAYYVGTGAPGCLGSMAHLPTGAGPVF
ncbi:MAG TPA: hypothetical protein VGR97_12440 [Candidatus Acidoferrales bacterium]|nr:hypothetical protein [Candidatus Acidoferrales bacterium]